MTAQIAGFVTRSQAGLRQPQSVSLNITPASGGVALHYGGPAQPAASDGSDHATCVKTWLGWQNYHMDTHGWVDIAYTGGFCNHGYAFAGRGAGVRTAANGTNAGNQTHYAAVWIGGEDQTPTQAALDAADWWIAELRRNGAGASVKPHRYFKSTGCPGTSLVAHAALRDNRNILAPTPVPTPAPAKPPVIQRPAVVPPFPREKGDDGLIRRGDRGSEVKAVQARLAVRGWKIGVDGIFGPGTEQIIKKFQAEKRLAADGVVGPSTWRALWTAPR